MSQSTSTQTYAARLRASDAVRASLDSIVAELETQRAHITGVRGPLSPELKQSFDDFMQTASEVRGRPLLYPYVGSGLGNGALVELMDGSVKYDLITGIGVHFFGHSEPDLVRAGLEAAMGDTVMQGHLLMNEDAIEFNRVLVEEAR
jgi:acetylornithine aminotransferase